MERTVSRASGLDSARERLLQYWQQVRAARRVVIKIGSNLLTAGGTGVRQGWVEARTHEMARLQHEGKQIAVVTSGAVAAGTPLLGWQRPPSVLREKQAAAAAGQTALMRCYEAGFAAHGLRVGQVLISRDDVEHRRRYLNARDTLQTLASLGVVPVINENDTVMVEEIKFGDNDTLSANVADLMNADLLILLSDVVGFFDANPRDTPSARHLPLVEQITPEMTQWAGGVGSSVACGGMATKLKAAQMAARRGCHTVLTSGLVPNPIGRVFQEEPVGTLFVAHDDPLNAHKAWIANARWGRGGLHLDGGAVQALQAGKSLLAKGIVAVEGTFDRGDAVFCLSPEGYHVAKGAVNYHADDLRRIQGHHSTAFESLLGFVGDDEIIHRDHLVMLTPSPRLP